MGEKITTAQRSKIMSSIRSVNTRPELKLKRLMVGIGFKYHPKGVYGSPDFADKKRKIAIFVDGCFWHGCPKHYKTPTNNRTYWVMKIKKNRARDRQVKATLIKEGYLVLRIWEHEIS